LKPPTIRRISAATGPVALNSVTLTELPRVIADKPDRPDLGDLAVHMRELTHQIAMDADAWTPERVSQMSELFDAMASAWPERDRPERHDALGDALARGGPFPGGLCLEVGAGTGNVTGDLQAALDVVVSVDLSRAMLSLASPGSRQIQADGSLLPVPAGSVAVVALINMFLFPAEVARVLKADGVVLWVSTSGDATPIYLSPADVLKALPGPWHGISAEAGWGTWLTARRETTTANAEPTPPSAP
jgi:SAM-dependent methyltransferase